MAEEQQHQQQAAVVVNVDAIDAAKVGDQHRLRSYLDEQDGDVNLRDDSTQGTLLHVRPAFLVCMWVFGVNDWCDNFLEILCLSYSLRRIACRRRRRSRCCTASPSLALPL